MTQSAGKDGERELANRLADLDSLSTQLTDSWYSRARKAEIERAAAIEALKAADSALSWCEHRHDADEQTKEAAAMVRRIVRPR